MLAAINQHDAESFDRAKIRDFITDRATFLDHHSRLLRVIPQKNVAAAGAAYTASDSRRPVYAAPAAATFGSGGDETGATASDEHAATERATRRRDEMPGPTRTTQPLDLQVDANGNAIVYDVYARSTGGRWEKDHGEYTTEAGAQRVCDRLNAERPGTEHKPRRRRGMKAALYRDVRLS